ncbi:UDP-2,4-diacetamido-2,4,6-trideoxy-beta-L-altropyranose hydrolase [Endothiovibrio diazotrophicus]
MVKRILFRVDASQAIGTGHLMRCLTLAERLRERGAESLFLCAAHDDGAARLVDGRRLQWLPGEPALDAGGPRGEALELARRRDALGTLALLGHFRPAALVVDHYRLDASWERSVRGRVERLLAIDDLADRDHACDLLLDQNLYEAPETRYAGRLPAGCRPLLGPAHALLRPDFLRERRARRRRDGRVRRIQLFFGGTDPTDETTKALRALQGLEGVALEVVAGAANPYLDALRRLCAEHPAAELAVQVKDMARRMGAADLALGAVGASYLERCAVGLPTVAVITAENQREVAGVLARRGAIESLGWHATVSAEAIRAAVEGLLADPARVVALGERSAAVMAGWRGADGVADLLLAGV